MKPIPCENTISLIFFMESTYCMSTKLKLHITLRSPEQSTQCVLCAAAWASPGSLSEMQNLGPPALPHPRHRQEESVSSPGDAAICFKARLGGQGTCVCIRVTWGPAETTPARALAPGGPGGLQGGSRGICILKKLHGDFKATSWLRIHPLKRL